MGKIIELSPEVYNRIAAGEVIENPASVVKELLENSLDADSTEIKITIKNSGKKEITVIDNGNGMDKDDLYLAIKKHTTSKIKNTKDLNRIKSLGFRGEALSSIVSIAIVELSSRTNKTDHGIKLYIENAGDIKENQVSLNKGTSVKVQNLFYNTPVRFKFLKKDNKELLNIKQIVTKLIIPHYNINFQLMYEENKPQIFRAKENIFERLKDVYGEEFCNELIFFKEKTSSFSLYGYISKPSFNKPNRNYQFLFLNKRPIITQYFHYWLTIAYENLLIKHRYPVAFIFIDVPPDFYDVNVHPSKKEVRFVNEHYLSDSLINAVKKTLNKKLLIPEIKHKEGIQIQNEETALKKQFKSQLDNSINSYLTNYKKGDFKIKENILAEKENDFTGTSWNTLTLFTLFDAYILYEKKGSDFIYIIDQHAAHERIIYERLKRDVKNEKNMYQNLLIPIHLQLSNIEYQIIMDHINVFKETGYQIEDFGSNSIIINSVPAYIHHIDDKQLFLDILSDLMENKDIKKIKIKEKILTSMACHSAIKTGDKISFKEKEALIKELLEIESRYTCPHGRPAIVKLTKVEIEKWFKRK